MSVVYEKIVGQDIELGHGTVQVTNPAGGVLNGSKVGIHTLLGDAYLNAADFPGADAAGKIAAAIAALPSDGGTVDARALVGTQTWGSNPFTGTTVPVNLVLGDTSITVNTSQILIPSNIHICGAGIGRTIISHGSGQAIAATDFFKAVSGAANIQIADLTIDGQASSQTPIVDVSNLRLTNTTDVRVERVRFLNAIHSGIMAHGVIGLDILNCEFSNWKAGNYAGIHVDSREALTTRASNHIKIVNNRVDGSVSGSSCIKVSATAGFPITLLQVANNFCTVGDGGSEGTLGIELWSASGQAVSVGTITGNTVVGENNTNNNIFGISVGGNGCTDISITGNSVSDCQLYGIEIAASDHISVCGNVVNNSGSGCSPYLGGGLVANEVSHSTYCGNSVKGYDIGISLYSQNFQRPDVSDNSFVGNSINLLAASATAFGIKVQSNNAAANISHNSISNNIIYGDGTAGSKGLQLEEDFGTLTDTLVSGNIFHDVPLAINFVYSPSATQIISNVYRNVSTTIGGAVPVDTIRAEYNTTGDDFRIEPSGDVRLGSFGTNKNILIYPSNAGEFKVFTDGNDTGRVFFYGLASQAADTGMVLNLGGKYTDAGDLIPFVKLAGMKSNSDTGDYAGYFSIRTRTNGGGFADRIIIEDTGSVIPGTPGTNLGSESVTWNGFFYETSVQSTIDGNGSAVASDFLTMGARRFLSGATPLLPGNFSISSEWGDTPAATVSAVAGTDQAFSVTVSAGTANFGANPTITLNFTDLTFVYPPVCVVSRGDATAPTTGFATVTTTTTGLVITFQGTPEAGTYTFNAICFGSQAGTGGGGGGVAGHAGPNYPSAAVNVAGSGIDWINPTNVYAADGSRTTSNLASPLATSDYLEVTGFGFALGGTEVIDGIELQVLRSQDISGAVNDKTVQLMKAGVAEGDNKAQGYPGWPQLVDAYAIYGGPTDLWGTTWTPADINATDFGVSFRAWNVAAYGTSARVDCMRIIVYYH